MSSFGHAQMGSCANKVCHRSSETGELWCARLREWRIRCPKDEAMDSEEDDDAS